MSFVFEWDPAKAASNASKHGVTFDEAATAFADPYSISIPDPDHSRMEIREVLIGRSAASRLPVVVYGERRGRVRVISARQATGRERRFYEEDQPQGRGLR